MKCHINVFNSRSDEYVFYFDDTWLVLLHIITRYIRLIGTLSTWLVEFPPELVGAVISIIKETRNQQTATSWSRDIHLLF